MAETKDIKNIPVEKFNFAKRDGDIHDKKFDTKPVGYWQDAFRRFCKNKGAVVAAIVILFLLLFAIIGPFCTPYSVSYSDQRLSVMQPKNQLFVNWGLDFWDGCKVKETGYVGFLEDYAKGKETGKEVIKNGKYTVSEDGSTIEKEKVLQESGLKFVIVEESLNVIVEGTIKYYTDAIITGSNQAQTTGENVSIVVFQ